MDAGALREKLLAELEQVKRDVDAGARETRERVMQDALGRGDFQLGREDHNVVFAELAYLRKCATALESMRTTIDAWHAAPGPDPSASARSLALRFRRAALVGPSSFGEDPKPAWVRIETPATEPEPPGDLVPRLVAMYRRWAGERGFAMVALSTGEPHGGALLRVEGIGAYGLLKTESGEHRFSTIESGRDGRQYAVRIEVDVFADLRTARDYMFTAAPGPVAARHDTLLNRRQEWDGGISLWAHLPENDPLWTAVSAFLCAAMSERHFERLLRGETTRFHDPLPLRVVREYSLAPAPLVRDAWSGIETRDVDSVLSGEIDRFLDGPERGDPF